MRYLGAIGENISRHVHANENARQRVPAIFNISAGARVQNRKLDRRKRTKDVVRVVERGSGRA